MGQTVNVHLEEPHICPQCRPWALEGRPVHLRQFTAAAEGLSAGCCVPCRQLRDEGATKRPIELTWCTLGLPSCCCTQAVETQPIAATSSELSSVLKTCFTESTIGHSVCCLTGAGTQCGSARTSHPKLCLQAIPLSFRCARVVYRCFLHQHTRKQPAVMANEEAFGFEQQHHTPQHACKGLLVWEESGSDVFNGTCYGVTTPLKGAYVDLVEHAQSRPAPGGVPNTTVASLACVGSAAYQHAVDPNTVGCSVYVWLLLTPLLGLQALPAAGVTAKLLPGTAAAACDCGALRSDRQPISHAATVVWLKPGSPL